MYEKQAPWYEPARAFKFQIRLSMMLSIDLMLRFPYSKW